MLPSQQRRRFFLASTFVIRAGGLIHSSPPPRARMEAVEDLNVLYELEEQMVDGHWGDERLLNMIPGGLKGLKYLHEHKIVGRKVRPMPDQMDKVLEKWGPPG